MNCAVCNRPAEGNTKSNKTRFIGQNRVCHSCYQRIWKKSKEKNISLEEEMKLTNPPKDKNLSKYAGKPCSRKGCSKPLVSLGRNRARRVNEHLVCGSCYQKIWEFAKKHGLSLESAWLNIPIARKKCYE